MPLPDAREHTSFVDVRRKLSLRSRHAADAENVGIRRSRRPRELNSQTGPYFRTSLSADQGHHNVVAYTKLPRELFRIAAYNTGQVFVAGQTKLAKEKIKRDKDGYVLDAEGKRVPVVLQYSSFDFLKDKAKAIVEAHATEAAQRWNV